LAHLLLSRTAGGIMGNTRHLWVASLLIALNASWALGATKVMFLPLPVDGAATLVVHEEPGQRKKAFLVDVGGDSAASIATVRKFLKSESITHLDAIVVSHWDSDHGGGLAKLLELHTRPSAPETGTAPARGPPVTVGVVIAPDAVVPAGKSFVHRTRAALHAAGIEQVAVGSPRANAVLSSLYSTAYALDPSEIKQSNDSSTVLVIRDVDGGHPYLLTSDMTTKVFLAVRHQLPQRTRIVSLPHHGGVAESRLLISATGPDAVVASAPLWSRYAHPSVMATADFVTLLPSSSNNEWTLWGGAFDRVSSHLSDITGLALLRHWERHESRNTDPSVNRTQKVSARGTLSEVAPIHPRLQFAFVQDLESFLDSPSVGLADHTLDIENSFDRPTWPGIYRRQPPRPFARSPFHLIFTMFVTGTDGLVTASKARLSADRFRSNDYAVRRMALNTISRLTTPELAQLRSWPEALWHSTNKLIRILELVDTHHVPVERPQSWLRSELQQAYTGRRRPGSNANVLREAIVALVSYRDRAAGGMSATRLTDLQGLADEQIMVAINNEQQKLADTWDNRIDRFRRYGVHYERVDFLELLREPLDARSLFMLLDDNSWQFRRSRLQLKAQRTITISKAEAWEAVKASSRRISAFATHRPPTERFPRPLRPKR
jgi:beta-lactamase superfamily II metal-dependent hydrolase